MSACGTTVPSFGAVPISFQSVMGGLPPIGALSSGGWHRVARRLAGGGCTEQRYLVQFTLRPASVRFPRFLPGPNLEQIVTIRNGSEQISGLDAKQRSQRTSAAGSKPHRANVVNLSLTAPMQVQRHRDGTGFLSRQLQGEAGGVTPVGFFSRYARRERKRLPTKAALPSPASTGAKGAGLSMRIPHPNSALDAALVPVGADAPRLGCGRLRRLLLLCESARASNQKCQYSDNHQTHDVPSQGSAPRYARQRNLAQDRRHGPRGKLGHCHF